MMIAATAGEGHREALHVLVFPRANRPVTVIPTVASTITPIAARRSAVSAIHPNSSGDQTKPV